MCKMMHLVHKWLRARENDAKNSSDNQGRPNLMQKARWCENHRALLFIPWGRYPDCCENAE